MSVINMNYNFYYLCIHKTNKLYCVIKKHPIFFMWGGGGGFAKLGNRQLATLFLSVCLSVWNNASPTGRIFMKFDIWVFFENLLRKLKFHQNLSRITGTSHEDRCTFMVIYRCILLAVRNVSDRSCRENQNTHCMFSNFFPKTVQFMT